jgi:hypothetical protein
VVATVDFYDKTLLKADKIKNVTLERDLSAELEASELPMA